MWSYDSFREQEPKEQKWEFTWKDYKISTFDISNPARNWICFPPPYVPFFSPLSLFLDFTINHSLLPFIRCSITVTLRMALSFLFYPSNSLSACPFSTYKGIFLSSSSFQVCTESVTLFWPPEVKPTFELIWVWSPTLRSEVVEVAAEFAAMTK